VWLVVTAYVFQRPNQCDLGVLRLVQVLSELRQPVRILVAGMFSVGRKRICVYIRCGGSKCAGRSVIKTVVWKSYRKTSNIDLFVQYGNELYKKRVGAAQWGKSSVPVERFRDMTAPGAGGRGGKSTPVG